MKRLTLSLPMMCALLGVSSACLYGQAPTAQPAGAIIITNATKSTPGGPAAPYLSTGLADIMKMFQAGVEQPVILAFIQSSTVAYHPSAKEIIYLRDQGVSTEIITALLRRGGELRERAAEVQREERNRATPPPAASPAAPAPSNPPAPQASGAADTSTGYPTYTYASPAYATYPTYTYANPIYYPSYYGYSYSGCRPYGYRPYYYPSFQFSYRWPSSYGFGFRVGYGGSRFHGYGGYRRGAWSSCRF